MALVATAAIALSSPAAATQSCGWVEWLFNDCGYRIWISSAPAGLPIYNGSSPTGFKTESWYATDPESVGSIRLRSSGLWIPLGRCSKTGSKEGSRFHCDVKS